VLTIAVVRLRVDPSILHDVLVRIVHEAAAATHVLVIVTVHELLLRQAHELSGLDGIDALEGAGGGKGPARP
jgi:hypothetical protein